MKPLKSLYQWVLSWAESAYGTLVLFLVAFAESSFFPVPADPLLMALCLGKVKKSMYYVFICTLGSVLGGLFGYMLGVFFLDVAMIIIEFYGYEEKVFEIQEKMSTKGGFYTWLGIMFLAGFTPLPFKVFTITSGVISYNLTVFFLICLFTRGLRFFLVSYFTNIFGKKFGEFIEKKGALWFTITGLLIVIIAVILYFIFK